MHVRNFFSRLGVHRLPISWTSTTAIYATSLGFLTSKTLGCDDKMDTGSKATPLQALIWKLMQWMDYNSQQRPQFPVHSVLMAAEIDTRPAKRLNGAATPPQANQTTTPGNAPRQRRVAPARGLSGVVVLAPPPAIGPHLCEW